MTELKRGRPTTKRTIKGVRDLVRGDLAKLPNRRATAPFIQRLRDPHHNLARLIAAGLRLDDVAMRSGYSRQRIDTLMRDPTFKDLVQQYRGMVDKAFVESQDDYFTMATSNMLKAERQLAERLEEADESEDAKLPVKDLIAISRDAADRFGYGKKQTNLNVNADFAAMLEKAIKRSGKTIEGVSSPSTAASSGPPSLPPPEAARFPDQHRAAEVERPRFLRRA